MSEYNPNCLHCCITKAIHCYYAKHGPRQGDAVVVDISELVAELGKVTAEFVHDAPTRSQRRQFQRYARECLEAGFNYTATGKSQVVSTGDPIAEH